MFYFCEVTGFVDWFDKGFIYMRRVLNCAFAYECVHACVCVCVCVCVCACVCVCVCVCVLLVLV